MSSKFSALDLQPHCRNAEEKRRRCWNGSGRLILSQQGAASSPSPLMASELAERVVHWEKIQDKETEMRHITTCHSRVGNVLVNKSIFLLCSETWTAVQLNWSATPLAYSLYLHLTLSLTALIPYFLQDKCIFPSSLHSRHFSLAFGSHSNCACVLKLPVSSCRYRFCFSLSLRNNRTNPLEMFSMQRSPWELLLSAPNFISPEGFVDF